MSSRKISVGEVLVWLVVIALIVLIASPFALGFKIQNDYSNMIRNLSSMLQADVQIKQYDRGIFTSDVVLEYNLPNMPRLAFKETIIHGPVYLGLLNQGKSPFVAALIQGEMLPVAGHETMYRQLFAGQSALVYQNIIDFSGNIDIEQYVRPVNTTLEMDNGAPLEIQSSGITFSGQYNLSLSKLSGETSFPMIRLIGEKGTMEARNVTMTMSGGMGQNHLYIGDSVISLGKFSLDSSDQQFAMHNLSVRSMTSEKASFVDSQVQMNVQEIFASNERFGPAALNISVNGMNAAALKKLQDVQTQMQQKLAQGVPPDQVNAMMAGEMLALVPELLKQTQIKIDPMQIESELGKLYSSLTFSVDGLDQNAPADPLFLFTAMNLDFSFAIDEPLMRQILEWQLQVNAGQVQAAGSDKARKAEASIPMEQKVSENLQGLLDENWLTYNDGVYSSTVNLHQGQMMLNNKQIDPLAQIMSQMSQQ